MNFARKVSLLTLATTALCGPVAADFVGLNIGVSHWSPDIKGSFSSGGNSKIQLENDLGYKDTTSTTLNVSFEHPVPLLPNIKYSGADLNSSSNSTITKNLDFEGKSYLANSNISSTLDLSHKDIVLYYEILDNWVNIDVGLDLKKFDGKVSISNADGSNPSSIDVDETIPMLYLAARFDLPLTGFYVGGKYPTS